MKGCQRVFGRICRETYDPAFYAEIDMICLMNKSYSKLISNREVNGSVNAAQTKGVLSPEGKLRTNLSATVDLRKNEILEHNSFMIKNHKTKQNINSEVNGNVNAAQNKNDGNGYFLAKDAQTQFTLGWMYNNGKGVVKSGFEAAHWYRKAADQSHADAQNNLGVMYLKGDRVRKDYAKAVKWLRRAADQGHADAQNNLGVMYAIGIGVRKDSAKAVKWYCKAADQGNARALFNLGLRYYKGEDVRKNYAEAVKWRRKAAERSHAGEREIFKRALECAA
jgi:TPR repeat protein